MFYFTFFRVNISGVVHCEQGSPTPLLLLFVIFFFCSDSRRFSVGEVGDEPAPGNLSREQESGNEWKRKNLPRVIPSSAFERWQHIFSSSSSRRKKTMHRRKMCFFFTSTVHTASWCSFAPYSCTNQPVVIIPTEWLAVVGFRTHCR